MTSNILKSRARVRIANFSSVDLPSADVFSMRNGTTAANLANIRRYADLPYVFVLCEASRPRALELAKALRQIESPCYPYALVPIGGCDLQDGDPDVDVIRIGGHQPDAILAAIEDYAAGRFEFDRRKLNITSPLPPPANVDVVVVGGGISGLYAANQLKQKGLSFCVLEKREEVGGIWAMHANSTSRVNTSEGAYRPIEKKSRANSDHSSTREILEDIHELSQRIGEHLFLETEVLGTENNGSGYRVRARSKQGRFFIQCRGILLAVNDRVGRARTITYEGQDRFRGNLVAGSGDQTRGLDWTDKKVVIVGMGAFAVENARTALEGGAREVTVVCRRHGTVCPKIIDYLNFSTPYDQGFKHGNKHNMRNMLLWKKLYDLSGATRPECWMGRIKHPGHTISVSDIWFIGHFLGKLKTVSGSIVALDRDGAVLSDGRRIDADVLVTCTGFERNTPVIEQLCDAREIYNINYVARDFMVLADAYLDDDVFNSFFGSSVLEMVKFYVQVYLEFFGRPESEEVFKARGVEKTAIQTRKWSDYIDGATALIQAYPEIRTVAERQIRRRTEQFLKMHDLETYIQANQREWIDTHSLLARRKLGAQDCLPYVFQKLLDRRI